MSKYHNAKLNINGECFDSRKEYARYCDLLFLQRIGAISNLKRQVKYELLPTQREESTELYKKGPRKGEPKEGKIIEKGVVYIADFVYTDTKTGEIVVEDSKGVRTKEYVLKRKMMLFFRGIRVKET